MPTIAGCRWIRTPWDPFAPGYPGNLIALSRNTKLGRSGMPWCGAMLADGHAGVVDTVDNRRCHASTGLAVSAAAPTAGFDRRLRHDLDRSANGAGSVPRVGPDR